MSDTDRTIFKKMQSGSLGTSGAANAIGEVAEIHTRSHSIPKTGTENAATNVAETPLTFVKRKAQCQGFKYTTGTNVASNATNYLVVTINKRDGAGGAAVTLATYNTHPSAQGAITQWQPAAFSVVSNADATVAAGSVLTYQVGKLGTGQLLDVGVFTPVLEEV